LESVSFASDGFALISHVLTQADCDTVAAELDRAPADSPGTRCLLSHAWCGSLAGQLCQHPSISSLIPPGWVAAQCTYFEKSLARNWLVSVHQDLSIPVSERVEHPSLSGWSEKEGSLYVQAPVDLLQQLVAVRLHIDPCGPDDGPLRVVPRSHLLGRLDAEEAARARRATTEVNCLAAPGAALVLRPLVLHSSSKLKGNSRRRVLHFLFGPRSLPHGLRWQHQV
jgi:ectoine hydroxylase-related dioxygenase (phytanoyl-CoA dioxygenase family)